jgi:hypothetical protein
MAGVPVNDVVVPPSGGIVAARARRHRPFQRVDTVKLASAPARPLPMMDFTPAQNGQL